MKNIYLASGAAAGSSYESDISVIHWYLRDHYVKHGQYPNEYNWADHFVSKPIQEILDELKTAPPDIFGFSCYVWSYKYLKELAASVKEAWPDCIIVFGGPQVEYDFDPDFWSTEWYVDIVVPGQGEWVFTEFLDRLHADHSHLETAEILWRDSDGEVKTNPMTLRPKTKVWDNTWVLSFADDLIASLEAPGSNRNATVLYETTRGCPYGCIYCDWGGGIYSKVSKKPLDIVKQELEMLAQRGVHSILFGDANFGLFAEDVDIMEWTAHLKKKYGYPRIVSFDVTKSKHADRIEKILEILFENKMFAGGPRLALQDTNEEVLRLIDRKNNHWTAQFEMAERLKKKYDVAFNVDMIFGLPGQTIDSWRETVITLAIWGYYPKINQLSILPNSPLGKKHLREHYKVKQKMMHKPVSVFMHKARTPEDHDWMAQHGIYDSGADLRENTNYITRCFSFDEADLAVMNLMSIFLFCLNTGVIKMPISLIRTLDEDLQRQVYSDIFHELTVTVQNASGEFGRLSHQAMDLYHKSITQDGIDPYVVIEDHWRCKLNFPGTVRYAMCVHYREVLDIVRNVMVRYLDPDLVDDCILHQSMIWISPEYYPGTQRAWTAYDHANQDYTTKRSWIMQDTQVSANASTVLDIGWHNVPNPGETYYYQTLVSTHGQPFSKTYHQTD